MSKNRHFIGIFIYIFALLHFEGSIFMDDFAFRCPAFYLYDVCSTHVRCAAFQLLVLGSHIGIPIERVAQVGQMRQDIRVCRWHRVTNTWKRRFSWKATIIMSCHSEQSEESVCIKQTLTDSSLCSGWHYDRGILFTDVPMCRCFRHSSLSSGCPRCPCRTQW